MIAKRDACSRLGMPCPEPVDRLSPRGVTKRHNHPNLEKSLDRSAHVLRREPAPADLLVDLPNRQVLRAQGPAHGLLAPTLNREGALGSNEPLRARQTELGDLNCGVDLVLRDQRHRPLEGCVD